MKTRLVAAFLVLGACLGCESIKKALEEMNRPPAATSSTSPNFRPESYTNVAVIASDETGRFGSRGRAGILRQVEDKFIAELLAKGFTIAARSDVETLLEELRFQSSNLTQSDAARLGQMLNVPAVLLVTITSLDDSRERVRYKDGGSDVIYYGHGSISARLVGVESSEVLWLASYSGQFRISDSSDEEQVLPVVAQIVANSFPPRYSTVVSSPSDSIYSAKNVAMTAHDVRGIQSFLVSLGYDCGTPDGVIGPRTRGCIRALQRDAGLAVTGRIDDITLQEINELAEARVP
jgi:hypothetical protein